MKKTFIILSLFIISCRKEWTCEVKTTIAGQTTTNIYKITGSRDDMKDAEANGTFDNGYVSQTTECK